MRRTIWLPVAPFSINAYYYRDRRHKTAEAREWEQQVFHALSAPFPQKMLKELREAYEPGWASWTIRLTAFYSNFYTKDGNISNKTHDITNWEKPLVDLLFAPKYHEAPYPYGAPNLNCDDRFLVSLYSRKRPAAHDAKTWIKIQLGIVSNGRMRNEREAPPTDVLVVNNKGTTFVLSPGQVGGNDKAENDSSESGDEK